MSRYQSSLSSSNSGGTVMYLKNMLKNQISANGSNLREVNIEY